MAYKDIKMPDDIAYGVVGGPSFRNHVVDVDDGTDQSVIWWDQGRVKFNVAWGIRTLDQLQQLIALWRVVQGKTYSFRMKDWLDYSSAATVDRAVQPVAPTDQWIGDGDAIQTTFQVLKSYSYGGVTVRRKITHLVANTLVFSIDNETRIHCTHDRLAGTFDIYPRYDKPAQTDLSITHEDTNADGTPDTWFIRSTTTDLSGFRGRGLTGNFNPSGKGDHIQLTGFSVAGADTDTSTTPDETWEILEVVDANTLRMANTLSLGTATGRTPVAAPAGDTVRLNVHPAPRPWETVRAGYEFDVPVRFEVDRLPLRLADYGIGASEQIGVIEAHD